MCLVTNQQKPFVADRDIMVYKKLIKNGDDYHSPIQHLFKWKPGEVRHTPLKKVEKNKGIQAYDRRAAIRYYSSFSSDLLLSSLYLNKKSIIIGSGFHAATTRERLGKDYLAKIYTFVIPKGSKYYEDVTGLIVSDTIKMLKPEKMDVASAVF